MSERELTEEMEAAPSGPEVGAFFDFDGTLISGYSARVFFEDRLRRRQVPTGRAAPGGACRARHGRAGQRHHRAHAGRRRALRGGSPRRSSSSRGAVCGRAGSRAWPTRRRGPWSRLTSAGATPWHSPLRPLHTRWVASPPTSASTMCSAPASGSADGVMTGELTGPSCGGRGRRRRCGRFAAAHGVDLAESFGYANGDEDVAFLEAVGKPRPLNPGPGWPGRPSERGWTVRRFPRRGRLRAGVTGPHRGGGAGLTAAAVAGVAVGLLNRSRRDAANLAASAGSDLTLALAGVKLDVVGEENLWSAAAGDLRVQPPELARRAHHRQPPAPRHHRGGQGGGGGRPPLRRVRRPGRRGLRRPLGHGPGQVPRWISRAWPSSGRGFPSPSPRRGPARPPPRWGRSRRAPSTWPWQAGVPVVPIVIRNAGELMWRDSLLRPPGHRRRGRAPSGGYDGLAPGRRGHAGGGGPPAVPGHPRRLARGTSRGQGPVMGRRA